MKFQLGERVYVRRPEKDDPMESELGWTEEMDEAVGDYQIIVKYHPAITLAYGDCYTLEDGFIYAENWLGREGE